jgi:hypothetical protein
MRIDRCILIHVSAYVRSAGLRCKALRERPIFANVSHKGLFQWAIPLGGLSEGVMGERIDIKGSIA